MKLPITELLDGYRPEGIDLERWKLVLSNYDFNFIIENGFTTRPWELRVYCLDGNQA